MFEFKRWLHTNDSRSRLRNCDRAEDIFDVLVADTTFSALVGEVDFGDATETALIVTEGAGLLDNLEAITGLLVTIEKDPQVTSTRYLTAQHRIDRIEIDWGSTGDQIWNIFGWFQIIFK